MKLSSSVEAPGSVRLVKALTLCAGALTILAGVAGEGSKIWSILSVAFGVCCVITTVRIKHGWGRRVEVNILMTVVLLITLTEFAVTLKPVSLFGLLLPVGVLIWANGRAKAWFDSGRRRA